MYQALRLIMDGEITKGLPHFYIFNNMHLLHRNDQELLFRKNDKFF